MRLLRMKPIGRAFVGTMSAVLLLCALVGTTFTQYSMNEARSLILENRMNRAMTAAEDLDNQIASMQEIALRIKTRRVFKDAYVGRNPYYEIELLEEFAKFGIYSPLNARPFLVNRNRNVVYSASSKYSYYYFHRYLLGVDDDEGLRALLYNEDKMTVRFLYGEVYVAFPININDVSARGMDSVVLFIVNPAEIRARIMDVAGLETEKMCLVIDGIPVLGTEDAGHDEKTISVASGRVGLTFLLHDDAEYERLTNFQQTMALMTVALCVVCAAVAVLLKWRSQKPIRDMLVRYNLPGYRGEESEIQQIEHLVDGALAESRMSRALLEEQMEAFEQQGQWLRHQLIMLLFSGRYDDQMHERMNALGIETPHECFCVLVCELAHTEEDALHGELMRMIESMSDREARFYPVSLHGSIAVLMNMESRERVAYAAWMLTEAANAIGLNVNVHAGTTVEDIGKLPISFATAFSNPEMHGQAEVKDGDALDRSAMDDTELKHALNSIQRGEADEAAKHMNRMMDQVDEACLSMIQHRFVCVDIASKMVSLSGRMRVQIPEEQLGMVLLSTPDTEMRRELVGIARKMANDVMERSEETGGDRQQEVVQYIEAHLGDPQLNADQIATEMLLSPRQINAAVKKATGMSYREYVIRRRMDTARRLLEEEIDMPVSEISVRVGYANIPYFIRAFKADTGYSPGEYRKKILSGEKE